MLRPLPKDSGHNIIQAGTRVHVLNLSISAGVWTPVVLPVCSKGIVVKTREGSSFKLAHEADGDYITVNSGIELALAASANETVFFVQSDVDAVIAVLIVR